jgi:cytochrome c-type biogenesis protein CcmE
MNSEPSPRAADVDFEAPRKSRMPLILGALVIVAAFGYLLYGGISKNLTWDMTPNQLLAQGVKAYDRPIRLGGQVVPGSIVKDPDNAGLAFRVRDVTAGPEISVHSRGLPTAMFREGIGVVVEGKYTRDNGTPVFHATTLMVKHSNEYKPPTGAHPKASDSYKSLIEN